LHRGKQNHRYNTATSGKKQTQKAFLQKKCLQTAVWRWENFVSAPRIAARAVIM
jgi:hypothetical protein